MTRIPTMPTARRARRLAGTLAALGLVGAGPTAVAAAQDHPVVLHVQAPVSVGLVPGQGGAPGKAKTFDVVVTMESGETAEGTAHGVTVSLDLSRLTGEVQVTLPSLCTTTGTTALCHLGTVVDTSAGFPVTLSATPGAAAGDVVTLPYTVTADDAKQDGTAATRISVRSGPDLAVPKPSTAQGAAGSTADVPVTVANNGDEPTTGVSLFIDTPFTRPDDAGLTVLAGHSNCKTGFTYTEGDPMPGVYCTFDTRIAPDEVYALAEPLKVRLPATAGHPRLGYGVDIPGGNWDEEIVGGTPGTGPALKLVKQTAQARPLDEPTWDLNEWDDFSSVTFTVSGDGGGPGGGSGGPGGGTKGPDLAAVGDTVQGEPGEEFTATVGVKNVGDAAATGAGDRSTWTVAEIPEGVTVTHHPAACKHITGPDWADFPGGATFGDGPGDVAPVPTGTIYYCYAPATIPAGATESYPFHLKAAKPVAKSSGLVYVASSFTDGQKNNVGALTITVAAATGSTSSAGATGSPGTSGTSGASGTSGSAGGGGLAGTGAGGTLAIAGASGAALVLGTALYVVFRRRTAAQG
jgi:hypothetical protein